MLIHSKLCSKLVLKCQPCDGTLWLRLSRLWQGDNTGDDETHHIGGSVIRCIFVVHCYYVSCWLVSVVSVLICCYTSWWWRC